MSANNPEWESDLRRIVSRARNDGIEYGKAWASARSRDNYLLAFVVGVLAGIGVGVFL